MTPPRRRLRGCFVAALLVGPLAGCAAFVPLRDPPALEADDPIRGATTRDQVIARLGPPLAVRPSDAGQVLVYRRVVTVNVDPSRYYGQDRGARLDRYQRVLVYLDGDGRVVGWTAESE